MFVFASLLLSSLLSGTVAPGGDGPHSDVSRSRSDPVEPGVTVVSELEPVSSRHLSKNLSHGPVCDPDDSVLLEFPRLVLFSPPKRRPSPPVPDLGLNGGRGKSGKKPCPIQGTQSGETFLRGSVGLPRKTWVCDPVSKIWK